MGHQQLCQIRDWNLKLCFFSLRFHSLHSVLYRIHIHSHSVWRLSKAQEWKTTSGWRIKFMWKKTDHSLNTYLICTRNIGVNWKPTPQFGHLNFPNKHNVFFLFFFVVLLSSPCNSIEYHLDRMRNTILYIIIIEWRSRNTRAKIIFSIHLSFIYLLCNQMKWNEMKEKQIPQ